jgi:ankyrin repeat protein
LYISVSADNNGASPLHLAVLNGHKDCAALLIERGVVDLLFFIPHLCISEGSLVDSQDDRGMTPLHHAVEFPECVRLLLEEEADVDAKDVDGRTPLFYAILDGHRDSAILLLYSLPFLLI